MGVECDICFKTLSCSRSLRRHKQTVHKIQPSTDPFTCSDCNFTHNSLQVFKNHFLQQHGLELLNHCSYCNQLFGNTNKFITHMEVDHCLPTKFTKRSNKDIEHTTKYNLVRTAFKGNLQVFEADHQLKCNDLFELLLSERSSIQQLVRENTRQSPKKVQLTAELELTKPKLTADPPETITIHVNTKMIPVYFYGLGETEFNEMVETLTLSLYSFASHGSGWILTRIKSLLVKMCSYSPIRGSSYIALPTSVSQYRS